MTSDNGRKPDDPGLNANLGLAFAVASEVATKALVELGRTAGIDKVKALYERSVLDAKRATIEGMSIEADTKAMNNMLTTVEFLFLAAREELEKQTGE